MVLIAVRVLALTLALALALAALLLPQKEPMMELARPEAPPRKEEHRRLCSCNRVQGQSPTSGDAGACELPAVPMAAAHIEKTSPAEMSRRQHHQPRQSRQSLHNAHLSFRCVPDSTAATVAVVAAVVLHFLEGWAAGPPLRLP